MKFNTQFLLNVGAIFIVCLSTCFIQAQDTLSFTKYADGGYVISISKLQDTLIYSYYSKDKLESVQSRNSKTGKVEYIRYYRNGKKMWNKQIVNGKQEGKSIFYDNKGVKIAELSYINNVVKDTIYLLQGKNILFGNVQFRSVVYGGMENEDGTSNISSVEGTLPHLTMKLMRLKENDQKSSFKEYHFTSDFNGDFLIVLEEGMYGLFNKDQQYEKLTPGQFLSMPSSRSSSLDSWNLNEPIFIKKNSKINFIFLLNSSVGYAP